MAYGDNNILTSALSNANNSADRFSAYGDIFGGQAEGPFVPGGQSPWSAESVFGNMGGIEGIGKGIAGIGDLFGTWSQYQNQKDGLKLAKQQLGNQAKVSDFNMNNRANFLNNTAGAFGGAPTASTAFSGSANPFTQNTMVGAQAPQQQQQQPIFGGGM